MFKINTCSQIIVALMQKNRRSQRHQGLECLTIGFAVYRLPDYGHVPKPLDVNFFKYNASVGRSQAFINLREVSARFKFEPGSYVIVPSTFEPDEEGEFLVRVFSEKDNNMEENDEDIGMGDVDDRVKEIAPNPEPADPVREFFNRLAGDDGEVDWQELKEILDYAMREGVTAGGCRNYLETFWRNPQYTVTLTDPDEGDDENKCTIIVALMQKNRRSQRHQGLECLTIGFAVYRLPDYGHVPKPLDVNFFKYNASVGRSQAFINLREVSARFKFEPGSYVIVPSTFEPDEEGEFLVRVFSEKDNNMEENDEDIGMGDVDDRVKEIAPNPEPADPVREFFNRLAGDDGEVDWQELKEILDYAMREELKGQGFSKDVCRSMIAMLDKDGSGGLGFDEFKSLWIDLRNWRAVFRLYDVEGRGAVPAQQLRDALHSAGYTVNAHVLNVLAHRYGGSDGYIQFDDFIMCAVRLKTMIGECTLTV
ncbi:hypothetical protein O3G_MSEX000087 [Manduca sexta]|nr:hypothetical protein O3G_MSEX000087 [Manduca sexta]